MILSAQTIRQLCLPPVFLEHIPLVEPFHERSTAHGMTFGLSAAGYDVRLKQDIVLQPGEFSLASTIEKFALPADILAIVHDKSSLARRGLSVFNTVVESGWFGFLTLELKNQGHDTLCLAAGSPIAQMIFHRLDKPTDLPYRGKYQDQADRPVDAIDSSQQAVLL